MYRYVVRTVPRRIAPAKNIYNTTSKRLLSTAPPAQRSRSWKSSAARWALAAGGIYYYNTSNVFAEEPEAAIDRLDESLHHIQESRQPTVDAIVEEKRQRQAQRAADQKKQQNTEKSTFADGGEAPDGKGEEGLEGLEEEAGQQGAFNPETGEINFDCPCLGGMAHGPCGEEFRAAFSCFVYSDQEPKGVECIEKFKGMQDCFRQHPDVYGAELEDDDDDEGNFEDRPHQIESEGKDDLQASRPNAVEQPSKERLPEPTSNSRTAPAGKESPSHDRSDNQSSPGEVKPETKDDERIAGVNAVEEPSKHRLPDPKSSPGPKPASRGSLAPSQSGDEGGDLVPKAAFDATSK